MPETVDGPQFLKIQPSIECSDNDEYNTLYYMSTTGLMVYLVMFGTFSFGLTVKRDLFDFLGDKFEDAFYFWELILLSRKVLIMMSFLFFSGMVEQAWFLGSAVMVVSLLLHAAAKPYEDELIDWCEFLSLMSTLFIFQAGKFLAPCLLVFAALLLPSAFADTLSSCSSTTTGVVFKVLNDPSNPAMGADARSTSNTLETASILLTFVNIILTAFVEVRVWKHVRDGEEDYRVRMLKRQRVDLERQLEEFVVGIDRAKAMAAERAAHRASHHQPREESFDQTVEDVRDGIRETEFENNPLANDEEANDEEANDEEANTVVEKKVAKGGKDGKGKKK